jgi:glycine cleavage system H protein
MSEIPTELRYTKAHEWVKTEEDGNVTIGVSDHAQAALGDLVFVELAEEGAELVAEDAACVVESVKAASDVYAPISGEVIAANAALEEKPELVNTDPYGDGWLFKLKPTNLGDLDDLMSASEYEEFLESEE